MAIFGFNLSKNKNNSEIESFVPPREDDGAIQVESAGTSYGSAYGYELDIDQIPNNEYDLLTTYRDLAIQSDIDEAITEIVNESIVLSDIEKSVNINLDDVELSDNIKQKIRDEFETILKLLKFKHNGSGLFRKWYVDGKLYCNKIIDNKKPNAGLVDIIFIEPEDIKLIREVTIKQKDAIQLYDLNKTNEYYIYSPSILNVKNSNNHANTGLRINKDAITYIPSGLVSSDGKTVLSHLFKSIKPFNNLRLLEDSVVIYRVSRAPERRVFYVDTGNLPKGKAEQHLKEFISRFKNKIVYDPKTGSVNTKKNHHSMLEDFWIPRREGSQATQIDTLPGATNLGELGDVEMFKMKLYKSLNTPLSRFNNEGQTFNLGRTTEITRDEIKFNKFIKKLRNKFSFLFHDLLRTQLILKKIITNDDWDEIKDDIFYSYLEDNYFQELKESEILRERLEVIRALQDTEVVGKYYSHNTIRKRILMQTEEEIKLEDEEIAKEEKLPKYAAQEGDFGFDDK